MIEILQQNAAVKRLLGREELRDGAVYHLSQYAYPYEAGGRHYLYHNLTNQLCCLETAPPAVSARFSAEDIRGDRELSALFDAHFLVREREDEAARYVSLAKLLTAQQRRGQPKGLHTYTILPTTACNARCFYCFERGRRFVTMDERTVDALIRFILETGRKSGVVLNWFGGEPLLCVDIIDRVCAALRERDMPFTSMMTTNGSLIDEALARKMKDSWKMKWVQVSLDGEESEYNRRKAYPALREPYRTVMRGIALLKEQAIDVNLRCNFDADNLATVPALLSDLDRRFPDKRGLTMDFVPLYENNGTPDEQRLHREGAELSVTAAEMGFRPRIIRKGYSFLARYCPAQHTDEHTIVAPDGSLYCCEHCDEGTEVGSVFEGFTNQALLAQYAAIAPVKDGCRDCPYLPECTTFPLCSIKNAAKDCRRVRENYLIKVIEQAIAKNKTSTEEV